MKRFKSGGVVLVGSNLPHYWKFDEGRSGEEVEQEIDVRVVHFSGNFWGDHFLQLPENIHLKIVLDRAQRGLQVEGAACRKVAELLERLLEAEGMQRILLLMEALHVISGCGQQGPASEAPPLSSIGFLHPSWEAEHERVNTIYEYSLKNFRRAIQLDEIAAVANISPHSFCRFFKSRTRKTYSRFLIEIRVGHACKLLIENNLPIKRICYDSGFNNFTGFYKYFKLITGKSPLGYQQGHMTTRKQHIGKILLFLAVFFIG